MCDLCHIFLHEAPVWGMRVENPSVWALVFQLFNDSRENHGQAFLLLLLRAIHQL